MCRLPPGGTRIGQTGREGGREGERRARERERERERSRHTLGSTRRTLTFNHAFSDGFHACLGTATFIRTDRFEPSTPNPQPSTPNPQPSTLNPQPSTLNPQPSTLNPQPSTLNPQPHTPHSESQTLDQGGGHPTPRGGEGAAPPAVPPPLSTRSITRGPDGIPVVAGQGSRERA